MPVLTGTAYWASINEPNTKYEPTYSINLVVDKDTAKEFSKKGYKVKEMEEGPAIIIKRKVNGPRGLVREAPKLYDRLKNEIKVSVGNGSKVKVQYKEWESERNGEHYQGLDLMAVQVLDLVEYRAAAGDEFGVEESDDDSDVPF